MLGHTCAGAPLARATPANVLQLRKHYAKYRLKHELGERKKLYDLEGLSMRIDSEALSFSKEEVEPCTPPSPLRNPFGVSTGYTASIRGRALYYLMRPVTLRETQQKLALALAILPWQGSRRRVALVTANDDIARVISQALGDVHRAARDQDESLQKPSSRRSDSLIGDPFDEPQIEPAK